MQESQSEHLAEKEAQKFKTNMKKKGHDQR